VPAFKKSVKSTASNTARQAAIKNGSRPAEAVRPAVVLNKPNKINIKWRQKINLNKNVITLFYLLVNYQK
jgi:hypothetical protein